MTGIFLEMEDAIVERLTDRLATLDPKPKVCRAADLDNIKDRSQGDLRVFVLYNGIAEVSVMHENAPNIGTLTNEYLVWVVARSAKSHADQSGTKMLADPVLEKIIVSLMGARLIKTARALHIVPSTIEPAYAEGFGFFPLTFHHRINIRGEG